MSSDLGHVRAEVARLLAEGRRRAAENRIDAAADAIGDVPLRFSVMVQRPNETRVGELAARLRAGKPIGALRLKGIRRLAPTEVVWRGERMGQLPAHVSDMLRAMGPDAKRYVVHVLEISFDPDGALATFAIELERPERRVCSSCGAEHDEESINCESCRAKRKRKGDESLTYEAPPAPLAEALDELLRDDAD